MRTELSLCAALIAAVALRTPSSYAGGCMQCNPPGGTEGSATSPCGCSGGDGDSAEIGADCIKVRLGMGHTTPWTGSRELALKVFADDGSPMVFTPDSLYPIMGYTYKRLGSAVMSDGVTASEVVFSHPNGEPIHFVFREGESLGRPDPGVNVPMDERLQMVDARGWATTHDPVYWDLYENDGSVRRFVASDRTGRRGELVSVTDSRGMVTTPADMGVDLVYGPDGVRQFLTPSRLADVRVVDGGYDVAVYPLGAGLVKDPATGLYPVPDSPVHRFLSVRPENGGKRAVVTLRTGDAEARRYVFDYVSNDWSLTRPDGVREIKDRVTVDSSRARLSKEIRSPDNAILSKSVMNYKWESWGYAMTNKVEGFGGVTRTTSWTYYTSGGGTGKVKTSLSPTGLLTEYAYDSAGRETSVRRSGLDMMAEVTTYSYTSVDPSDIVPPVDTRPRTVVKTLDGIECERTYYVYSPLTNIVERVGTQGAPYGSTNALRTITAFYPAQVGAVGSAARVGKIKSIRREDGRLDLYDYDLADGLWTETVTHLHEQSPAPVSGKTTRDTTLTNRRGETVERKTEAFIDGTWYVISRNRMTYNLQGKRIRVENLAGQVTTTAWDCCHKVSETQPDGSTTTWDYDDEGRMIASSRLIPLDLTNVTWVTTCYAYDGLGRQTATWTTNFTEHIGIPATTTSYDALGRVIARTDVLGNVTTTTYSPDGRTVSVFNPNSSTIITTRDADGDVVSIVGTAVTPEFRTYGIISNGTRWTKIVYGETADSLRYTKRYENMLVQNVRSEKSGFRGAVLVSVNSYDDYGRLVSMASDGDPTTTFTYDAHGMRIATARTIGVDVPGGMSEWRKTVSSASYALADGAVWTVQTDVVSCSDATIAPLVQSRAGRVVGLTPSLVSQSLSTDIRGNITESWDEFAGGITIAKRKVPEATNIISSRSRYGIDLEFVSISAVTNTIVYDALGRVSMSIDGRGNATRTEYDSAGRHASTVDAFGARTSYAYDRVGNLIAVTNALGNVLVYEYDLRGRKIYEGGSLHPIRYTYNIYGEKVSMTSYRDEPVSVGSTNGDTTVWCYDDSSGIRTNIVYANGRGISFAYTAEGRLARRIWARGVVAEYSYDGWGNNTKIAYSDGTPEVRVTYDVMGRLMSVVDSVGMVRLSRDDSGYIFRKEVNGLYSKNMTYHRDIYGRSTGYSIDDVRITEIGYDADTARVNGLKAGGIWCCNNYLPGTDLRSCITYGDVGCAYFSYEPKRDLIARISNEFEGELISRYDYTYDAKGRRVSKVCAGSAISELCDEEYGYNDRNELVLGIKGTEEVLFQCRYDAIGNRINCFESGTNCTYDVNNLNQYTAMQISTPSFEGEFTSQFDLDGNQTLVKTSTGVWSVTYNAENRPVRWSCGSTNIIMSFDWLGRRVEYLELHQLNDGVVTTNFHHRFVYDGYHCVQRLNASANNGIDLAVAWDPYGPFSSSPLMIEKTGVSKFYVMHDGNKNVSDLVSVSEGKEVKTHYEYGPFGACIMATLDSEEINADMRLCNPFRFSSEYFDESIGLLYYNFRHYDCTTGRMLSRDPLSTLPYLTDDFILDYSEIVANTYRCFSNNPISHFDFLGREDVDNTKKSRTESDKNWWASNWTIWPLFIPNPNDVYGNYCGACRINGRYFGGNGQEGWKREEIGEGCGYYYYDGKTGERKFDTAPSPKDDYDRCCMEHDRCLADVDQMKAKVPKLELSKRTKSCDEDLSVCWMRAYMGLNLAIEARVKTTTAIPVMVIVAHPKDTANIISGEAAEIADDVADTAMGVLNVLGQGMRNAIEDSKNSRCEGSCLFKWSL